MPLIEDLKEAKRGDPVIVVVEPWWQSKTIWLNLVTATMIAIDFVQAAITGGHVLVPNEYKAYLLLALGVMNIYLRRFSTDNPVK